MSINENNVYNITKRLAFPRPVGSEGGAISFINKHHKEYDPEHSFFINLDLIGGEGIIKLITSYGIPRKIASKKLNDLYLEISEKLNIDVKSAYLPTGAWSDFMPIVHYGFEACWLAAQQG